MKRETSALLAGSLVLAGAFTLYVSRSEAQFGGGSSSVLQVEGRNGGPIQTEVQGTPTVSLAPASLASLTSQESCTYVSAPPVQTLTTTPADVPATSEPNRNRWRAVNEGAHNAWCCIGSECTPTSSARWPIYHSLGDVVFDGIRSSDVIRCRSESGTTTLSVQEAVCTRQ